MSHAKNKVEWCLKKAEKELKESEKHRGLVKQRPNLERAKMHLKKAEHYLRATEYLKKGDYSDISASTVFYAMYHCLLAIAAKYGYESRNQECTFSLVSSLIEEKMIDFNLNMLNKIASLDLNKFGDDTSLNVRERYQYGIEISIDTKIYDASVLLAKDVIILTKEIIEGGITGR